METLKPKSLTVPAKHKHKKIYGWESLKNRREPFGTMEFMVGKNIVAYVDVDSFLITIL